MPNTASAIRRVRRVVKQTAVNRIRKSKYRAAVKKMDDLIATLDQTKIIKGFLISEFCKDACTSQEIINKITMKTFIVFANDIVSNTFNFSQDCIGMADSIRQTCLEFERWAILTEQYDTDFADYKLN